MRFTLTALLGTLLVAVATAQPPEPTPLPLPAPAPAAPLPIKLKAPKDVPQPTRAELESLEKTLRTLALAHLPTPLVKSDKGWGKQKEFVEGRVMLRNAKKFGPEAPRVQINDGLWRRITVTARNPNETLGVSIPELVKLSPDAARLGLDTVMDIDFRVEHQFWKRGLQLYSGETRGHCKAGLKMKAEVLTKTKAVPGSFLPEVTITIKATEANLFYDKVVIDHTAGLDGADAQKAGEFVIDLVKAIKPDLEQQLLEKANAAIMKAAASKEVKVPLDKLLAAPVKK
ncbi:hypothetical protein GobsT_64740 [Gemmata obscuriglobus]|uniref:Uncharacterized protein n=1 Tax=Gemmata obscuriglobus TaxID=114 RepID=A0A2Z3GW12_9BACT|nr:hypothetical protein [Gemmata obscuriglobus]AWM35827.1 hypothetical protein C1280_01475 [Gemmata obscuriglobus]QEG31630.1 hypothetical protein GobsT_64740 [Gemmata obscuriglobus]VTS10974.1 Uncharacterized protein OS=Blastopirellula marina DSM 3645 GN=DSM3645_09187 PE=4 SV=1 [Gemmata obscuriglobus UQM 2246]